MSNLAAALLEEITPELVLIIRDAVKAAMAEADTQPRYPERVTVTQASEITGYSKNSLYQMHSRGQVPGASKVGGKLTFETAKLREWVSGGSTPKE